MHHLIIWCVLAESILQIQSNSWFTCAQFFGLLAGGLWWFGNGFRLHEYVPNIGCLNIPGTDSHYPYAFHVFIPTNASSFTMFHPWIYSHLLCHWATAFSLTRAAKRLLPSAGWPLLCVPALSRYPRAFCLGSTSDIRSDPFQYHFNGSPCGLPNLMCGNHVRKALFHSSYLAHTDVKDMDEL